MSGVLRKCWAAADLGYPSPVVAWAVRRIVTYATDIPGCPQPPSGRSVHMSTELSTVSGGSPHAPLRADTLDDEQRTAARRAGERDEDRWTSDVHC
ncbi:hypothetical protein PSU4_59600 [Pseudonocardia sulfidoxydans NBRC 16205]|uniref:Uncharacterized protein n=1 Tax=Pseudonocardia sulfidoxydans NBRC 16205 TaxID=1223511 RepID=A0A511DQ86_9PSEU|nr:hypothetical protein PSU4_59600 [Pseudonocardia sulfidoxydans NBRC 16205]